MKTKIIIPCFIFTLSLLSIPIVNAQNDTSSQGLEKRLIERRKRIKVTLTTIQETRIKTRCIGAQTRIIKLEGIAQKHSENQDKRITTLIDKITLLTQKQKDKGRDTTKIDAALVVVSNDNETIQTARDNYIAALADSSEINCKTDPSGFRTSLEDARTQFSALKTARRQLIKDLKDQLKPALQEFRIENK